MWGEGVCYSGCMDTANWHILQVASGFEVEVAQACGVPSYVPRRAISYYNRRKRVKMRRTVPALPGFVFVQSDAPQTVKMSPRPEIFGFMRNGNRTFSVLHPKSFCLLMELEKELLGVTDADLGIEGETIAITVPQEEAPGMALGQEITPGAGPFVGRTLVVKEIRGDKLLAELVEASMRIELKASDVRAA